MRGADDVPRLRCQLPTRDRGDLAASHLGGENRAVEQGGQVGLKERLAVEDAIPDGIVERGIAVAVFELDLFEDSCFLILQAMRALAAVTMAVRPADPHADFGRG